LSSYLTFHPVYLLDEKQRYEKATEKTVLARRLRTFSRSFTCKCTPSRPLDLPRLSGSRPDRADTDPSCILFVSLRRLSRTFVSFATLSFRMKKTVQISRIVSEIHINETLGLSPSVETHSLNPMLIPIPRLRRQAQREESHSDGLRPVYPFVAVILSSKQALNILNIFHRMHKYSGHRQRALSLSLSRCPSAEKYATDRMEHG